jgi:RND superfamily putative drug exporter
VSSLLYRLGLFVARRRRWVIAVWLVILVGVGGATVAFGGDLEDDFSIPGSSSQQGIDTLELRFPEASGASGQLVFGAPPGSRIGDEPSRSSVEDALERVRDVEHVSDVDDPFEDAASISPDGRFALVTAQFDIPNGEVTDEMRVALEEAGDPEGSVTVDFGGQIYTDRGVGLSPTEAVGVVIAFLVLLITFGSVLAAGLPLIMTLVGVGVSFGGILLTAAVMPVSTATPSLALMIGLAVGIDYGLFILSRHRRELATEVPVHEAIARSLATAGSAVTFAGATVIIALVGLTVAGIPFLGVMGLAAAGTVAMAMVSTLTFFPALLVVFGERLRPKPRRKRGAAAGPNTQSKLSRTWIGVTKGHPIASIVVTSGVLLLLLIPAAELRFALNDNGTADPGTQARTTYDLIAEEFGSGYNAALVVTADIISSTDPLGTVDDIEADLAAVDGVAAVTRATPNPGADLALFRVIPEHRQGDERTIDLVHTLREEAPEFESEHDVTDFTVTGITAVSIDTSERLTAALLPFGLIVAGLSFLLSMIVFRSIAIPIKATVGFALSISAAFGVVGAVYGWGWGAELLNVQATGPVISFFPIMVIGILFGLSMDYEVFLVARIREEYVRTGDAEHAIDEGYRQSQTVVNAAGIIMIAVFVAFIPEGSATLKPLAIALAVGVFVDAFVIRMTLARAVLYLLGRRAWWLPGWLDRRLPHLDVEGAALEANIRVRERAERDGERVVRSIDPPLDIAAGDFASYADPDDQRRREVTAAIAGWGPAAPGLEVLGQAMPAGRSRASRYVVRTTAESFASRVPPRVGGVGVVRRYLLSRGQLFPSRARLDEILAAAELPAERSHWSLLDQRRLDLVLADAVDAQLVIVDDIDVDVTDEESDTLASWAAELSVPTILIAGRAPAYHHGRKVIS